MKYSLVTRDLIADSTECMALAHQFDALVMVPNLRTYDTDHRLLHLFLCKSQCIEQTSVRSLLHHIAGKGIANPIATILSAAMMLRYSFDLDREADAVEAAARMHPLFNIITSHCHLSSINQYT